MFMFMFMFMFMIMFMFMCMFIFIFIFIFIQNVPKGQGFWGGGADRQTDRQTDKQTHTHINTMTRPGLGAGPSEEGILFFIPIRQSSNET